MRIHDNDFIGTVRVNLLPPCLSRYEEGELVWIRVEVVYQRLTLFITDLAVQIANATRPGHNQKTVSLLQD